MEEELGRYTPNEQDRTEREMTHVPFRNWCRHCVMSRERRGGGEVLKSDRGRTACTRSSSGLHVHVRRKVEKHAGAWGRERHDDENCVHYSGAKEADG